MGPMLLLAEKDRAEAVKLIASIEEIRGRKLFCVCGAIDSNKTRLIEKALSDVDHQASMDVLIHSGGGSIDDAFRMIKMIRRKADSIEFLVADYAKSAATFMCLSGDKILMGPDAELGPLDAQLSDPKGSVKPLSALNAFKSLEYLREFALEAFDLVVRTLLDSADMDIPYAVKEAQPLVANMVSPLFSQVDPLALGEARRLLSIGEEYGKLVMSRYSYRETPEEDVDRILRQLVWNYPHHGFLIDLEEAIRIGLKAEAIPHEVLDRCGRLGRFHPIGTPSSAKAAEEVVQEGDMVTAGTPTAAKPADELIKEGEVATTRRENGELQERVIRSGEEHA
jgi:Serine dehydrogenase proteinase